jgi:glycerate dehydrogenase
MNIVVLDGFTLNPGDLDWSALQLLGDCTLYNRSRPEEILHRAMDADIILTNKAVLSKEILAKLTKAKYIGVLATGYNVVDVSAARERGIVVTNVPAYSTPSVAQVVFAMILEFTHRIRLHADLVQYGAWTLNPDFSFSRGELIELSGRTMGIVGFGSIGQAVARIAGAMGMNVIVSTKTPGKYSGSDVLFVDQDTLFTTSDVISLHCALTDETKHLINNHRLYQMKHSAILINTSRGGVIDEQALANALNNDRIAGAGLDVLSVEPPPKDHPLLTAKNCIVSPHYAWATSAARKRLMTTAVENVRAFITGKPVNVVS